MAAGKDTYNTTVDNEYTVNAMLGKQLIATDNVAGHYDTFNSPDIKMIVKGNVIGTVYSWYVSQAGKVYWVFNQTTTTGKPRSYYVEHDKNKMSLSAYDKAITKTASQQAEEAKKAAEKEDTGTFVYYVERWGKPVLITAVASVLGYAYIKSKNSK